MDLSIIQKSSKQLLRTLDRNSPTILTGLGVAGLIGTVILAVKATPKAVDLIEKEKTFRHEQYSDEFPINMTPLEIVETTWQVYIPTALMGGITIACMIASNHISLRRNAALVSLYTLAEATLKEYQDKVSEQITEKKERTIREDIVQDHLDKNPVDTKTIVFTGNGNYLCFDDFSKRYFRSDVEAIRRSENQFNQHLLKEGWLGINDFYDELGLEPIELGDEFGWVAERSLLQVKYDAKLAKDTNEPCLVIGYTVTPNHI